MGWFLCRQPNGLFARFSTSNNVFTHFNMTEDAILELAFEEWDIGKYTATQKLNDAKEDKIPLGPAGWINQRPASPVRWNVALQEIRKLRTVEEKDAEPSFVKKMADEADALITEAEKYGNAPGCTCPTECNCEAPPKLASNKCPAHNKRPQPSLDCLIHGADSMEWPDDPEDNENTIPARFALNPTGIGVLERTAQQLTREKARR